MIEPEENMSATESEEETIAAKKDMEERSSEGHDPNDERGGGGPGGEAGGLPGMDASERMNEEGHEARDEGVRHEADDAPGRREDQAERDSAE